MSESLRTTNYQAPQALHTHLIKNNKKILIKAAMARKFFTNDYIDAQHQKATQQEEAKKANLSVFNMNERIMSDYFIKPINDQLKIGLSASLRNSLGSRNILNPHNIAKTMNEITRMNNNQSTSRSQSEEGDYEGGMRNTSDTQLLQSLKNEILKN